MTHDQIKDYLLEYNIQSEEQLAVHIEELKKNTFVNNKLIFPLVEMLVNEKSVLLYFFRENEVRKIDKKYTVLKNIVMDNISDLLQKEIVADWHSNKSSPVDEVYIKFMQSTNPIEAYKVINPHIKYTILEQNTLTDKEQEQLSRDHTKGSSTRHKSSNGDTHKPFFLDECIEKSAEKELEQKEKTVISQLEDKTDKSFADWMNGTDRTYQPKLGEYARNEKLDPNFVSDYYPLTGKIFSGVKESQSVQKAPIFTYCKVNKNALEALALRALYGHDRYKDTDQDWQNFTRVPNGDFEYANAQFRHALDIGAEDEETHLIASAWNAIARLEIFLRQKD